MSPEFDWARQQQAYGSAENVPSMLAGLRSTDAGRREEAEEDFWSSLCHQDTVYSATGPAIEATADLILDPNVARRHRLLFFIAYAGRCGLRQGDAVGRAAFAAASRCAPRLFGSLQDRGERLLELTLGYLLAVTGPGTVPDAVQWTERHLHASSDEKEQTFWRCSVAAQNGTSWDIEDAAVIWATYRGLSHGEPEAQDLQPDEIALIVAEDGGLFVGW
jgi:hypothetical protein